MAKIRLIQTIIIFVTQQRFSLVSLGVLTYGEVAYRKGMWRFQGEYWLHGIAGSLIHRPDGCAKLIAPVRAKQLSTAATAEVIWLCACVRKWPYCGVVTCASVLKLALVRLGLFEVLRGWEMSSVNRGKIKIKRVKLVYNNMEKKAKYINV